MSESLGPVSKFLEHELRQKVPRHSLVVWLDADGAYCDFADQLIALRESDQLPYEVQTFQGSFLELMFNLEPLTSGITAKSLVVHMPGFNTESIRDTPLLEMYLSGSSFKKNLDTLIGEAAAGRVLPAAIDAFRNENDVTLADADTWLTSMLSDSGSSLAGQLRLVSIEALIEDLLSKPPNIGPISSQLQTDTDRNVIWDRLGAAIGLPVLWRDQWQRTGGFGNDSSGGDGTLELKPDDIAFAASTWALSVEYVDDLKRPPIDSKLSPASGLAGPLVDNSRALAEYLRDRHPEFYIRVAHKTEAVLLDEVSEARPEDLGKIDTFRFEDEKILSGALDALSRKDWAVAADWAGRRIDEDSFWLRRDPKRRSSWLLIADTAALGSRIDEAGPNLGAQLDHPAAIDRYTKVGAAVDRAHRQLEQRRHALWESRLPESDRLKDCLDSIRLFWRDWADQWARDFNAVCSRHGFLPQNDLQQRNLFDQVVAPIVDSKVTTALFVIDAFRYEMAAELLNTLSEERASTCRLDARMAELPTITSVGMNVLAPVVRGGRLKPAIQQGDFKGFSTGEYRVADPKTRQRAMHDRVGGKTCPLLNLKEVVERDKTSLKRAVAKARLVIVHSKEIDAAGEADLGPAVFNSVMKNLRAAWRRLRDAGVKQFVFTADHGFLLREGLADVQSHGRKIDPNRRHVVSSHAADHNGEVRVPLSDLGYDDAQGHLFFPETTAAFDTGDHPRSFVHGGNSLQERLIPVLTLSHRADAGGSTMKYQITGKPLDGVGGMHCLSATVTAASAQSALDFGSQGEVELAIRVPGADNITAELCQVRGDGAQLSGGSILATVDGEFELFFRLRGESEERVQIELYHPGAEVDVSPAAIDQRFSVEATRTAPPAKEKEPTFTENDEWLSTYPDESVRKFFAHLSQHGAVTDSEATAIFGNARKSRRFASQFENLAAKAPYEVRIDVIGGVKRYVRENETEFKIDKGTKD